MLSNAKVFKPNTTEEESREDQPVVTEIDYGPWLAEERKPKMSDDGDILKSCLMPGVSHLLISDDLGLLKLRIEKACPTGSGIY